VFFIWTHRRAAGGETPLLALEVVDSPQGWAAVVALLAIFLCSRLPDYRPGEIPSDQPQGVAARGERKSA
jgi:hypothetical protein